MSQYYKPKNETGREYVLKTKEFNAYVLHIMMNMPEQWKEFLTVPVFQASDEIESLVIQANRIYIPNKDGPAKADAVKERLSYLYQALRMFSVFDEKYDRLMLNLDLEGSEKARLKNIMIGILNAEKEKDPNGKLAKDGIEIRFVSRITDMEFRSAHGSESLKLKFTAKQNDRLLSLETQAMSGIRKRIASDNKIISELTKGINE